MADDYDAAVDARERPELSPEDARPTAIDRSVTPRHFAGFDGLRAIAATTVLLVHTAIISGFTFKSSLGNYTSRLEIGVSIFFLISGFLLYRPFAVSHLSGRRSPITGRFWERRILRIVPAYWLALTLLTYVFHIVEMGPGIGNIFIHYFFLQIYFPSSLAYGIGPAWSLCTEMSFYLVLPGIAAIVGSRRRSQKNQMVRELISIATLYMISLCFRWWWTHLPMFKAANGQLHPTCGLHCSSHDLLLSVTNLWLPAQVDLFALGMLLAVLSAWWSERESEPAWLSNRYMPWLSWIGAGVAFWSVSHLGLPRSPIGIPLPVPAMEMHALYGLFAFFLLIPAVFGPEDRSLIRRFLRCWPVASIGVVSYGIYLWHIGVAQKVTSATGYSTFTIPFGVLTIFTFVFTTAIASISYFGLEKQMLRIKGRLGWWNRPSGTPLSEADQVLSK